MKRGNNFKDKTGQVLGELQVLGLSHVDERKRAIWNCKCSCGSYIKRSTSDLQKLKSCGHLTGKYTRHGKVYNRWYNIKERTRNPLSNSYKNYGGRGIDMCDRWYDSFDAFLDDMGIPPEGSSLERIDNSKGYYKENCKWANKFEQASNKRNVIKIVYKGRELPLKRACIEAGIEYKLVHQRMKRQNLDPQTNFEWYIDRMIRELENIK